MQYEGSLDAPPIIIHQSRLKIVRTLALGLAMTALTLFAWRGMRMDGNALAPLMLAGAGFFALSIPLFSYQLLRPATLTLTPQGLSYRGIGKGWTVAWNDVAVFGVMHQSSRGIRTNNMVGWTYAPHYDHQKAGRALAATLSGGVEGAVPGLWSLKAEALADLMEAARQKWAGGEIRGSLIE